MNILGIDFEDWYHPELIAKSLTNEKKIPKDVAGIDKIIDFLRIENPFLYSIVTKVTFLAIYLNIPKVIVSQKNNYFYLYWDTI